MQILGFGPLHLGIGNTFLMGLKQLLEFEHHYHLFLLLGLNSINTVSSCFLVFGQCKVLTYFLLALELLPSHTWCSLVWTFSSLAHLDSHLPFLNMGFVCFGVSCIENTSFICTFIQCGGFLYYHLIDIFLQIDRVINIWCLTFSLNIPLSSEVFIFIFSFILHMSSRSYSCYFIVFR